MRIIILYSIIIMFFTPCTSYAKTRTIVLSGNGAKLNITIKVGDTVSWLSRLRGATVFFPNGEFSASKALNIGDVHKITFTKAGMYFYRVTSVKYGTGIIVVE